MNQTEQVTSITGADIDAAIQDERITPLETAAKAIFSLQQQVIAQNKCIEKLETVATQDAEAIGRLWDNVIAQAKHIEKLEAVLRNWLAVDEEPTAIPLFGLSLTELERRIERLEAALNSSDGSTYTAEHAKRIEDWGGGTR